MDTRGEIMDCHALPCKARNDRKRGFFTQDSRACCGAVDFHRLQRILGFCDDFVGCRVQSKGAYLVYVTAALRDDSLKTSEAVQGAAAAGFFRKARKSRIHQRDQDRIY